MYNKIPDILIWKGVILSKQLAMYFINENGYTKFTQPVLEEELRWRIKNS